MLSNLFHFVSYVEVLLICKPKGKILNWKLPQILIYCNIIYSKYGLKPFMTISFCGLILLEGIIIMSLCTTNTAGLSRKQAFDNIWIYVYLNWIQIINSKSLTFALMNKLYYHVYFRFFVRDGQKIMKYILLDSIIL